ncbi:MAG: hypothetical protein FWH29_09325 [Methanobrevibacter sp.]|nr:hypothetical protein [Methanobrevibacter sp.]
MLELKLIVKKAKESDIRRGWVRINENYRKGLNSNSLIKIVHGDNNVIRMLYGDNNSNQKNIYLDEPTRYDLGVVDKINEEITFGIKQYAGIKKIKYISFYLNHPDNALKFTTIISLISLLLGVFSLIIALISFSG